MDRVVGTLMLGARDGRAAVRARWLALDSRDRAESDPLAALAAIARRKGSIALAATVALFSIDPARFVVEGLHREPILLDRVLGLADAEPSAADDARFVARIFEDDDAPLVSAILSSDLVARLCDRMPELLPRDLIRARVLDPDPEIRRAALHVASMMHSPDDAQLVLDALGPAMRPYPIAWLGPLPDSSKLVPWLSPDQLGELLRRRRCAGVSNVGLVDSVALAADRTAAALLPGELVRELRDERLMHAWLSRLDLRAARPAGQLSVLGDAQETCVWFGAPARTLAKRRMERELAAAVDDPDAPWQPEYEAAPARFLWNEIQKQLDRTPEPPHESSFPASALQTADLHFAIDDLEGSPSAAVLHYARTFNFAPRNAHAAFMLAWIDRGYGTPITPARVAWLRSLGVRDDALLDELASSPSTIWPTRRGLRERSFVTGECEQEDPRVQQTARRSFLARVHLATS